MSTLRYSVLSLAIVFSLITSLTAQDKKPDPNIEAAKRPLAILEATADWKSLFNGSDLEWLDWRHRRIRGRRWHAGLSQREARI